MSTTTRHEFIRFSHLSREFPQLHAATYRRAIQAGRLPAAKLGPARNAPVVVKRADVERFLATGDGNPPATGPTAA